MLCLMFAMDLETAPFLQRIKVTDTIHHIASDSLFMSCRLPDPQSDSEFVVVITGIGSEKAALSMKALLPYISHVINVGTAGALSPYYTLGSVVVPRFLLPNDTHDPQIVVNEKLYRRFEAALAHEWVENQRIISVERPIVKATDRLRVHATSHAQIVDMEAYTVAEIAWEKGIPFACIKVVSDTADNPVLPFGAPGWNPIRAIRWHLARRRFERVSRALVPVLESFLNSYFSGGRQCPTP